MAANIESLVLLFDTCADASRAVRLHAPSCSMINVAGKRRSVKACARAGVHRFATEIDSMQDEIDDLTERGFRIVRCKCTYSET